MRKLIYAINISLDGTCDHDKMNADEDLHDYHTQLLREVDVLLYGRKTYQLMVPFWPDIAKKKTGQRSMDEFAQAFAAAKKIVVFSKTLDQSQGDKTQVIRGNLKEEIMKLKQENGKPIVVGGVDLPSQLIQLDLIDEYHFVVQAAIVGDGRKILDGVSLPAMLPLKLAASRTLSSGTMALHYLRR